MQDWEWKSHFDLEPYHQIWLGPKVINCVKRHAKITADQSVTKDPVTGKLLVSGRSSINGFERDYDRKFRDSIVGGFGNAAINILWYGWDAGLWMFHQSRLWANAHPSEGDKGSDVPGFQVDMKGSCYYAHKEQRKRNWGYDLIRKYPNGLLNRNYEWGRAAKTRLDGTPLEGYKHAIYWKKQHYFNFFMQSVPKIYMHSNYISPYNHIRNHLVKVYITGWCHGSEITHAACSEDYESFEGAYCKPIPELHPLKDFPGKGLWWWDNGMSKIIKEIK